MVRTEDQADAETLKQTLWQMQCVPASKVLQQDAQNLCTGTDSGCDGQNSFAAFKKQ